MSAIQLPISKSIANRLLMCKAMRGDDISGVIASPAFASYPDDVRLLAKHLVAIEKGACREGNALSLDCANAGTVIRFLTAYAACLPGLEITLYGNDRMGERPIGQLVEALRAKGAEIEYVSREGFPPLHIRGKRLKKTEITLLQPQSSQFVSALLLAGFPVHTDSSSPYIALTQDVIKRFEAGSLTDVEKDWSAAAFWYEREILYPHANAHFESLKDNNLPDSTEDNTFLDYPERLALDDDSLQGDRIARQLFCLIRERQLTSWDFTHCPDLYPAAAVTCHLLGLHPTFTGLQSLRIKESDRLRAVSTNLAIIDQAAAEGRPVPVLRTYDDHRIAMAFLAAGFAVDHPACISKSYPAFLTQLLQCTRVVAIREGDAFPHFSDGLITCIQPDKGRGKKSALLDAVPRVHTEYVWFTDADIEAPAVLPTALPDADMLILPLEMKAHGCSLIEQLQVLEYDAIQAITMLSAERGRPVMCAGANLIVRRESWLQCSPDIRLDIASGDDMFILESMKRHHMRIQAADASFTAYCKAQPTLRLLLKQRMRWAGKAPAYRDNDILLCGALTVLSNILVVLLPGWLLVKWLVDMGLIIRHRRRYASCSKRPTPLRDWLLGLLLTLVYPFYILISIIGGLFRRHTW